MRFCPVDAGGITHFKQLFISSLIGRLDLLAITAELVRRKHFLVGHFIALADAKGASDNLGIRLNIRSTVLAYECQHYRSY